MQKRVFDSFPFCDELDLLEARLIELDQVAYRHVLVEAPVTFQGTPKPLYYAENQERFSAWQDKIIHVVADLPAEGNAWAREHATREAIRQGLDDLRDDDIFLLGDADEIPRASIIRHVPSGCALPMRNHLLAVNLLDPGWWPGTMVVWGRPDGGDLHDLRTYRLGAPVPRNPYFCIIDCGWHFSWLGGPEAVRRKTHSHAHVEMTPFIEENAERMWRDKISPVDTRLVEVAIDDTWPEYMQERKGPAVWYWGQS